jgi:hypothetical protein
MIIRNVVFIYIFFWIYEFVGLFSRLRNVFKVGKKGENPKETDKLTYDPSIGIAAPYDDSTKMNSSRRIDNTRTVVDRRNNDKDSNCKGDDDGDDDDDDDNGSRDIKLSVMISIDDDEEEDDDDNGSSDIKSNNKSPYYDNNVIHQHVANSIEGDNHNNDNNNTIYITIIMFNDHMSVFENNHNHSIHTKFQR